MTSRLLLGACVVVALAGVACRRAAPEVPPPSPAAPAVVEVLKGGRWLFTYVEPAGTFATTDKPETIPEPARAVARVFDPSDPSSKTNDASRIYVVNVNELLKAGKASARPLSRDAFETAALAQLPPGESSPLASHTAAPNPNPNPAPPAPSGAGAGAAPSAPAAGGPPVVTIYGTSWCGACRAARQYFTEKKIPFADKDIEQDAAAARELADKAAKMGLPTDRVPVIDVRGRLLLGFDRARIEALLGQST
jgi:glutaredoxin